MDALPGPLLESALRRTRNHHITHIPVTARDCGTEVLPPARFLPFGRALLQGEGEVVAGRRRSEEALATGRGVAELVRDKGLLPAGTLAQLLPPEPSRDPVKPWCDVIRRDLD